MKNGADISGSLCAEVTKIGVNSAPDFYRHTAGRQQLAFAVWMALSVDHRAYAVSWIVGRLTFGVSYLRY